MKELEFTPISTVNSQKVKENIQNFSRKIRLVEIYSDINNEYDESLEKCKSNLNHPRERNTHVNQFIDILSRFPFKHDIDVRSSILKQEGSNRIRLRNDFKIVINLADKEGTIAIMDTI